MAQGDEDEQDEEQNRKDCHYGDVAGVGQRRAVRSLGRNHVGQVQHVAQRPAGIAAFNLDTRQRGRGKAQSLAASVEPFVPGRSEIIITNNISCSR